MNVLRTIVCGVLALLTCDIVLFQASISRADESQCELIFSFITSRVPAIVIAPDHPAYLVTIKDVEGTPIEGAVVVVQFPACFAGSLQPDRAPGVWSDSSYVPSAAYEFADTTDVDGVAVFDWTESTGTRPSGGCIPVDLIGPSGSCAEALGCVPATVEVIWEHDGTVECGKVERSIVSPDIASGGRLCDIIPWEGSGASSEVGLEDAVEFTSSLTGGDYEACTDLNGDGRVNVFDAVKASRYFVASYGVVRSAQFDPFYGDSLHLPIGVGDSAVVITHALLMNQVELAITKCDSANYTHNPELDRVYCLVTESGLPITLAQIGFELPTSLELPDSVNAIGTITVTTILRPDTVSTTVALSASFLDVRGPVPLLSQPGDSTGAVASLYDLPQLFGEASNGSSGFLPPWCSQHPGCAILEHRLTKVGPCIRNGLSNWQGLPTGIGACIITLASPLNCISGLAAYSGIIAVGCSVRAINGSED